MNGRRNIFTVTEAHLCEQLSQGCYLKIGNGAMCNVTFDTKQVISET